MKGLKEVVLIALALFAVIVVAWWVLEGEKSGQQKRHELQTSTPSKEVAKPAQNKAIAEALRMKKLKEEGRKLGLYWLGGKESSFSEFERVLSLANGNAQLENALKEARVNDIYVYVDEWGVFPEWIGIKHDATLEEILKFLADPSVKQVVTR